MPANISLCLILFLPLFSAVYTIVFRHIFQGRTIAIHASIFLFLSMVLSWYMGFVYCLQTITVPLWQWLDIDGIYVHFSIAFDQLSAVMMVMISTISFFVHMYSIGYMIKEKDIAKFMSYIGLFTFFMLFLVFASNLIQLFFGWEGVGFASYLLIGYWYKKASANKAAMKAFVMNRVGDLGLLLGIILCFYLFGSVEFSAMASQAPFVLEKAVNVFGGQIPLLTVVNLLFFFGAIGKSAQFGLHNWLPDAMEGPTPASALIHAATMVTAGVFLIVRLSPLYSLSLFSLEVVAVVGLITSIFAGTVAIVQNDLKKTIAYSTCSQLGMMFFAVGVQAYSIAIFHLVVHACFKSLLFLGAGAVIQSVSGEKDMQKMGGLFKYLPKTCIFMWAGSLALIGFPFFAGYYSKDAIMEAVWSHGGTLGTVIYWGGLLTIVLTAVYTIRMMVLIFHGKNRQKKVDLSAIQEVPRIMLVPMFFLAVASLLAGAILKVLFVGNIKKFWAGVIAVGEEIQLLKIVETMPYIYVIMPVIAGAMGAIFAWIVMRKNQRYDIYLKEKYKTIYHFLYNQWYMDRLYDFLFCRPYKAFSMILWRDIDKQTIDKLGPHGISSFLCKVGEKSIRLQTGDVCHYILAAIIGVGCIIWLNLA